MPTLTSIHSATMRLPLHLLVADLNANLGNTLVAFIANVRSRQLPTRWASEPGDPQHSEPRDEAKKRLQLAHQAFKAIEEVEDEHIARQWLIGANPWLDGQSPAEQIREYDASAVYAAVRAFLDDAGGA